MRRTNAERREQYHELMDAKAAARAELEAERRAVSAGDEGDEDNAR
jgi:GTP-binding protein